MDLRLETVTRSTIQYRYVKCLNRPHPLTVQTLIDSGTSDLIISTDALNSLVTMIDARKYQGKYVVDCKKRFSFSVSIQNKLFELTSEELMFEIGDGYCQLAINDNSGGTWWSELWILGDPFYRAFCITHNFNRTVGIAHHHKRVL